MATQTTIPNKKTGYNDLIDLISVSATPEGKSLTLYDKLENYIILVVKYGFLVSILTLNFMGLSVALNCNVDEPMFKRVVSAIFAFFFGFVYLLVNYYTFKVIYQGKLCKFSKEKLFPFKA